MKRHPNLVWITCFALGLLFDFLFWKHSPGMNFAIYVALCLLAGGLLLHLDGSPVSHGARALVPLILLFSAVTFMRAEPLTVILGIFFSLFMLAMLAVTFRGGRWLQFGVPDYIVSMLGLAKSVVVRPLWFRADVSRDLAESGAHPKGLNPWPVLRGLLFAIPVLVVFAALLASADLVFGRELGNLLNLLKLEQLPEYVFRLTYVLAAAYSLAGVFLHAATPRMDEHLVGQGKALVGRFLGFVEASIVLGAVTILFTAFVVVQFRYFFGGQVNIGLQGYTYSEYARRGFGELMAVAFCSLLMIIGLGTVTRRDARLQQWVFSGLGLAIVGLVNVMLVSAFQRLGLYEIAYGFSRLRTYAHVMLIWIGVLLATVALLELLHRERSFAAAAVVASLGFALTLGGMNVDEFIVRQNVNRAVRGESLDVAYLVSLSTDTVPALAQIFQSPSYPVETREAIGAVLACRAQLAGPRRHGDWRSFTLPGWRAENALRDMRQQLSAYRFIGDTWPARILTPSGVEHACQGSEP